MADTESAQAGTQEGADELDWIPENYRRDTIEETARVLLESQKGAQREMLEATTARRNLEQLVASQQAQIEQIQSAQQAQPEATQDDWYAAYEADPIATQRAIAQQELDQRFSQWQKSQSEQAQGIQGSQAEIVAGLAYRELEDRHGKLTDEQRNEMARVATESPHLIPADAVASPQKLAAALDIVYRLAVPNPEPQTSSADLQRAMKLQAQSATGAGGHLSTADENAQRWQEIQNAPSGTLGL